MSHLTKAQLASRLTDDAETQSALLEQSKSELVELYRQTKENPMMFSSDDEEATAAYTAPISPDGEVSFPPQKKASRRSSQTSASASASASAKKKASASSSRASNNGVAPASAASPSVGMSALTEETSLVVSGVNVAELTDEELYAKLKAFGIDVGPIVESTRQVYQKKLAILLRGGGGLPSAEGTSNGNGDEASYSSPPAETVEETTNSTNGHHVNNGFEQYSADEEEVGGERDDSDEEEDVQPEPVKRTSTRGGRRSMSKASNASNSSKINEMRKRMNAALKDDPAAAERFERFTPTPRRSIHSYKMTETSKETMVKTPDGNVTRDYVYQKSTTDNGVVVGEGGRLRQYGEAVLRWTPKVMVAVLFVAVIVYTFKQSRLLATK